MDRVPNELQRDWAREKTIAAISEIMLRHGGKIASSQVWEAQLLATQPQAIRQARACGPRADLARGVPIKRARRSCTVLGAIASL